MNKKTSERSFTDMTALKDKQEFVSQRRVRMSEKDFERQNCGLKGQNHQRAWDSRGREAR